MSDRTVTIVLIEDDLIDIEAIRRGFKKHRIANPIVTANDGIEGLDLLRNGVKQPYLVLLDLNMPRMNGLEFLKELRADPDLQSSIVFVLTTSNDERDRWAAYEKHIAGYILKSQAGREFLHVIEMLDIYWRYVEFPPDSDPHHS